jgi:hypothetical protein
MRVSLHLELAMEELAERLMLDTHTVQMALKAAGWTDQALWGLGEDLLQDLQQKKNPQQVVMDHYVLMVRGLGRAILAMLNAEGEAGAKSSKNKHTQ